MPPVQTGHSGKGEFAWVVSPLDCLSSVVAPEAVVAVVVALPLAVVWVCLWDDPGHRSLCVLLPLPLPNSTGSRNLPVVVCQCRIRVETGCLPVGHSCPKARVLQHGGVLPDVPSSKVTRVFSHVT